MIRTIGAISPEAKCAKKRRSEIDIDATLGIMGEINYKYSVVALRASPKHHRAHSG